jgi:hypothetical protein
MVSSHIRINEIIVDIIKKTRTLFENKYQIE